MAIKYIPFYPEPIEGQAVLNNFKRTLRYHGTDVLADDLRRGMPLYEMETKEQVGVNLQGNLVIRGECVSACAWLREQGKKIDLVYIDPPFASGADYAKTVYIRRNPKLAAKIKAAEQELDSDEIKAFEEKMYGDVWDKEKYLNWMYENLAAIKSVMSDTASIYVHLDWHIGHYVKVLMDEIFGEDNFRNEIIWKRSTAHNDSTGFGNLHDTIFYYALTNCETFNTQYMAYSEDYLKTYYRHEDEDGRKYLDRDLSAKGLKGAGYTYSWRGKAGYWRCPEVTMKDLEKNNKLYYTQNGTPRYKQYLDEMPGVPAQDIWTDIYAVNSQAEERIDYATQKPEALLERILQASSNAGMLVADFFGGSGVTAAVAHRLGRRFVHVDVGINSIQTARDRLAAAKAEFAVLEIKDGVALYRNPVQTMDKIKGLIPGLRNEDAVDEFWEGVIETSADGMVPVYVPNLMDSTTKLLTKDLMNKILRVGIPDLPASVKKVIVYYIDIEDEAGIRRFIDEDDTTTKAVELRDLKAVLDDVVIEDEAVFTVKHPAGEILYRVTIHSFLSDRVALKINAYNQKAMANASAKKPFRPISLSPEGLETIEYISLDCTNAEKEAVWKSDCELKIDKLGYISLNGIKKNEFWDGTIASEQKPLRMKLRNICGDETIYKL